MNYYKKNWWQQIQHIRDNSELKKTELGFKNWEHYGGKLGLVMWERAEQRVLTTKQICSARERKREWVALAACGRKRSTAVVSRLRWGSTCCWLPFLNEQQSESHEHKRKAPPQKMVLNLEWKKKSVF